MRPYMELGTCPLGREAPPWGGVWAGRWFSWCAKEETPSLQILSVLVPVIYAEITYQDVLEAGVPEFDSQLSFHCVVLDKEFASLSFSCLHTETGKWACPGHRVEWEIN